MRAGGGRATARAFAGLLLCLLAPARSPAQVHLRLEAGWDGVARRGGVVPVRITVRLPDDAPRFAADQPWLLRVSPQGGPWTWDLVLPVPLAPGVTRVVDAAIALHGEDTALAAALVDPAGRQWSRAAQVLALLPPSAQLGVAVGAERGLRRIRDEQATPAEITWIRLPPHQLPAEPAGWLDLSRLRWEGSHAQPPAATELGYRVWRTWTGRDAATAPADDFLRAAAAPVGAGWLAISHQLGGATRAPRGARASTLLWVAVAALAIASAVRPANGASPHRRRKRAAWVGLALLSAGWLALGAPRGAGGATPIASHSETIGAGLLRSWEVFHVEGDARRRAVLWPREDAVLIAPTWLPRDDARWELWWWAPGVGEPRWEVRPPRRGARGRWMGLAIGATPAAAHGHDAPRL